MTDTNIESNAFIDQLTEIIEENLSNENFGVSELADKIGMSRSNLLRKVKKATNLSVSLFIRQIRLRHAMELLLQAEKTVSEIAFEVGFNSTSYFIKCFHEQFGYPPGEAIRRKESEKKTEKESSETESSKRKKTIYIAGIIILGALITIIAVAIVRTNTSAGFTNDKSIAVLPFRNDSNDSSNVYIINGLMESILSNLQKIEDLRVISRTSVEKYRNSEKTIPEIAKELNVRYFIEGSGQKLGDKILLSIQLIEAPGDKHLWAEQYKRETKDIFDLQIDIAKKISNKIQVIITPEEKKRINKPPTDNLVAYDFFLKALDLMNKRNQASLEKAIPYLKKALEHDKEFALAYAALSISYYYMDIFKSEKQYLNEIEQNADKAIFYDSKLSQSYLAKALSFMIKNKNESAVLYLEKALQYNPNSTLVLNILSDFYTSRIPDTEKYLEYALKGIKLDIASHDSVSASFVFLHVSNALIQSGFTNKAEKYINKSLEYNPRNLYSEYLKAYIIYAKNKNLKQTKKLLLKAYEKDTNRLDILQEVAKICYYQRDFNTALKYYDKFVSIKKALKLDIYQAENAKIGYTYFKMGRKEEAKHFFDDYINYVKNDNSIYKHLNLAVYYSYTDDTEKAIENLKLFSTEDNFYYWIVLFLKIEPLFDNIKDNEQVIEILKEIEVKFSKRHNRIKSALEAEGLI